MKLRQTLVMAALILMPTCLAAAEPSLRYMQPHPAALLADSANERFSEAALDPTLEPWQRDILRRLAMGERHGGFGRAVGPEQPSTSATGEGAETWVPIPGPARTEHSIIYDPVRNRLIVFGGFTDTNPVCNDLWTLNLSGAPVWTELRPTGPLPPGRYEHTAIYDPVRDRMIVFAGIQDLPCQPGPGTCSALTNDTWALSLADLGWTELSPLGPAPSGRAGHTAVYDPVRDRMIVFGGVASIRSKWNDTWSLDLSGATGWSLLASTAPFPGRAAHAAICDTRRDRMVVFGGLDSGGTRGDLWALSFTDRIWREIVPADTTHAPARYAHSAIYDDVTDRMLILGGPPTAGCWTFSLRSSEWSRVEAPAAPLERVSHTATYDPVGRRMIVFGGSWIDPRLGDAWAYQLDAGIWSQVILANRPPRGRAGHVAIYDPVRQRMIIQGGYNAECECFFSDTWQLSLGQRPVWSPLVTVGPGPVARAGHVAVYDPAGDRMIIFGGEEKCEEGEYCSRPGNDAWALSLGTATPAWSPLSPTGEPPSVRSGATAVYDPVGQRMVVYGGFDFYTITADVWALELSGSPAWTPLTPGGVWPGARVGHSAMYEPVGQQMVVFGGFGGGNETLALDLAGAPTWRVLVPSSAGDPGLPPPRWDHSAVYDPIEGRMLLYGYDGYTGQNNDSWALTFGPAPSWSRVALSNSPPYGRVDHAAVYDPVWRRMVVHAGDRGYLYDTWALQSDVGIPTPVALALVSAIVKAVGVELEWFSADAQALEATLYRRTDESEWRALASVSADGSGHVRFVDRAPCAGARACYRLGYLDHGVERFSAETWVEMPERALALAGLSPNPAMGDLVASFSLASAAPARLSLLDVTGRAVAVREVGSLGPGRHTVALGCSSGVRAGVYWLRLAQGGRSLSVRGVVMR